jgi:hypothetical protein
VRPVDTSRGVLVPMATSRSGRGRGRVRWQQRSGALCGRGEGGEGSWCLEVAKTSGRDGIGANPMVLTPFTPNETL